MLVTEPLSECITNLLETGMAFGFPTKPPGAKVSSAVTEPVSGDPDWTPASTCRSFRMLIVLMIAFAESRRVFAAPPVWAAVSTATTAATTTVPATSGALLRGAASAAGTLAGAGAGCGRAAATGAATRSGRSPAGASGRARARVSSGAPTPP